MSRNRWSRVAIALLVPVILLSCQQQPGRRLAMRSAHYGAAALISVYHSVPASERQVAVLHLLIVPAIDIPKTMSTGNVVGISGSAERGVIDYTYEDSANRTIHAPPFQFHEDRTLQSGNQSFDLKVGNLFVADLAPTGAVKLSQLRVTRSDEGESADSVLRQIQAAEPQNARVQALVPR
jgi:hypothetical protein